MRGAGGEGALARAALTLLVAGLVTAAVAWLFYPGFMSYDTLHALRSARSGVTDSMWPPMVSYIWRAVDQVSTNPSAMHVAQLFLLFAALFTIVAVLSGRLVQAALFLPAYLSVPVILGTVAVIWKDVLMAAFFFAGYAATLLMRRSTSAAGAGFLGLLALLLIAIGVATRHNAVAGAVPLFILLGFAVAERITGSRRWRMMAAAGLAAVMIAVSFGAKTALDRYSLPSLTPLPDSTAFFIRSVRVLDLAGASLCLKRNLLKPLDPSLSITDVAKLYDGRHINLSPGLLARTGSDARVDAPWRDMLLHHPVCALANKLQLAAYLTGANRGGQFLITAPSIDKNEYGYQLAASPLRDRVVAHVFSASSWLVYRPWFIYAVATAALALAMWRRRSSGEVVVLYAAGASYFASLVAMGNAADARLPFFTTSALLVVLVVSAVPPRRRPADGSRP
ncbi:hypothetical protein DK847_02045 [Aestuariivirga litoralis]|uniref:Glycosyltransferase RgtA/B/C/D-like domain-containing protein n=1 Tax=Aestuariivirga litoralis TaxID=2650924 RepID=A0A2W2ATR0_9HYPH|nr:hypothetical protein [Aestuariivirga litoralis]PZF78611.1 hypothetical protein DK847_02045 [Aestuariivirga litoralis]